MGVRQMELVNKFDNALSGVAGDSGAIGPLVNARELPRDRLVLGHAALRAGRRRVATTTTRSTLPDIDAETAGRPVRRDRLARACPVVALPLYPPPDHCNARGLTTLGEYTIKGAGRSGTCSSTPTT